MNKIHNFITPMTARATIALDAQMLQDLRSVAHEEDYRSLSSLIQDVLRVYLQTRQEEKLFAQMKKDYQEYAKTMPQKDWQAFKEMEAMALEDLNERDPWK